VRQTKSETAKCCAQRANPRRNGPGFKGAVDPPDRSNSPNHSKSLPIAPDLPISISSLCYIICQSYLTPFQPKWGIRTLRSAYHMFQEQYTIPQKPPELLYKAALGYHAFQEQYTIPQKLPELLCEGSLGWVPPLPRLQCTSEQGVSGGGKRTWQTRMTPKRFTSTTSVKSFKGIRASGCPDGYPVHGTESWIIF
jgi:hypothetical protein